MVASNNVNVAYARALMTATSVDILVEGKKPDRVQGASQEQVARMEREMSNLQSQYKLAEQTYGEDMLNLVLTRGYIVKLLDNKVVFRYLEQHRRDFLEQFESLVRTTSMEL